MYGLMNINWSKHLYQQVFFFFFTVVNSFQAEQIADINKILSIIADVSTDLTYESGCCFIQLYVVQNTGCMPDYFVPLLILSMAQVFASK